ncbi:MAG: cytochrome c [Flavobacteriales bacterium]
MTVKTKIVLLFLAGFMGYFVLTAFVIKQSNIDSKTKVSDVLVSLGDEKSLHFIPFKELDSNKVKAGFNLVTTGFMNSKSKRQSKHFVCTDCHNIGREDPDLTKSDPETRLKYVSENGLKFLPATTLYGTVNKSHWYNEDYFKKYGDLVVPARDTLENAVQLCAVVCSQGRALTEVEMEAMMHFLNSIGYSVEDLNVTKKENSQIANFNENSKKEVIELIKTKYLDYSPATFMDPIEMEKRQQGKVDKTGNVLRGMKIFELSCLTCHKEGGVTNYKLHTDILTFNHLKYWAKTDKVFSVYDITRKGTYSKNGYKPYMPNFTKERLSDQQIEDLMSYIAYRFSEKDPKPIRKGVRKF